MEKQLSNREAQTHERMAAGDFTDARLRFLEETGLEIVSGHIRSLVDMLEESLSDLSIPDQRTRKAADRAWALQAALKREAALLRDACQGRIGPEAHTGKEG